MQLRTPKRYQRGGKPRRGMPWRLLFLLVITALAVAAGITVYENQDEFAPQVSTMVADVMNNAGDSIATARAPEPTPTQDPTTNINRADEAWMRGSVEEAVDVYEELMPSVPNNIGIHYRYTLGLIMYDRESDAIEAAENTVTANPFSPDAWSIRARAYSTAGNYGEAIASALHALEIASPQAVEANPDMMAPARARALASLAETYYELDQYQRALTTANQALDVYPDSSEAYYTRGLIKWLSPNLIDREGALVDFEIAYDLAPSYHYIASDMMYLNDELASIEGDSSYTESAIALAETVLESNPDYPRILQFLGDYYFSEVGDFNQAADYFTRCTQANPELANCHYLLGRSFMRLEQYTNARTSFDNAIANASEGEFFLSRYYWWAAQSVILLDNDCSTALTYLNPGWEYALESQDSVSLEAYPTSFQNCGSAIGLTPTPLPATEPNTESDA